MLIFQKELSKNNLTHFCLNGIILMRKGGTVVTSNHSPKTANTGHRKLCVLIFSDVLYLPHSAICFLHCIFFPHWLAPASWCYMWTWWGMPQKHRWIQWTRQCSTGNINRSRAHGETYGKKIICTFQNIAALQFYDTSLGVSSYNLCVLLQFRAYLSTLKEYYSYGNSFVMASK